MSDYTELVKALRCKRDDCEGCNLAFFDNDEGWMCQYSAKDDDAAAAIEALQAMLTEADKKQAYQHDYICELVAEVEELKAAQPHLVSVEQLPKRGEWIDVDEIKTYCSNCNWASYSMLAKKDAFLLRNNKTKFCPNCGAKMGETHEGT